MSTAAKVALWYFGVVVAVVLVVTVLAATDDGVDASFIGVWAIAATLPGSLLLTWVDVGGFGAASLIGVALVQALAIYGLTRLVTKSR